MTGVQLCNGIQCCELVNFTRCRQCELVNFTRCRQIAGSNMFSFLSLPSSLLPHGNYTHHTSHTALLRNMHMHAYTHTHTHTQGAYGIVRKATDDNDELYVSGCMSYYLLVVVKKSNKHLRITLQSCPVAVCVYTKCTPAL